MISNSRSDTTTAETETNRESSGRQPVSVKSPLMNISMKQPIKNIKPIMTFKALKPLSTPMMSAVLRALMRLVKKVKIDIFAMRRLLAKIMYNIVQPDEACLAVSRVAIDIMENHTAAVCARSNCLACLDWFVSSTFHWNVTRFVKKIARGKSIPT